jgi:uroporphyrin-III C-methyltransferase
MALKHIALIADRLLAGGRAKDEPVAVISKATTREQTVLESTLGACAEDVATSGIEPPAMVVVGQVVRLRAALDWLGAIGGRELQADPLGTRHHEQTGS